MLADKPLFIHDLYGVIVALVFMIQPANVKIIHKIFWQTASNNNRFTLLIFISES